MKEQAAKRLMRPRSGGADTYPLEQLLLRTYLPHVHTKPGLLSLGINDNVMVVMLALGEWLEFGSQVEIAMRRHLAQKTSIGRAHDLAYFKDTWWRAAAKKLLRDPLAAPSSVMECLLSTVVFHRGGVETPCLCYSITTTTFDLGSVPWQLYEQLIWPHLSVSDLKNMRLVNRSWRDAVGCTVTSLRFHNDALPDSCTSVRFPCVTSVTFGRDIRRLPPTSAFANLTTLHLPVPVIGSDSKWQSICRFLSKLSHLKQLTLEVHAEDLATSQFPVLSSNLPAGMSLRLKAKYKKGVVQLSGIEHLHTALTSLEVDSPFETTWRQDSLLPEAAARLTNLRTFRLHNCLVPSPDALRFLSTLPALRELDIGRSRACTRGKAPSYSTVLSTILHTLTALQHLNLSGYGLAFSYPVDCVGTWGVPAYEPVLAALGGLSGLTRLDASHVRRMPGDFWKRVNFPQLRAFASVLGGLTNLTVLVLEEVPLTQRLLQAVTGQLSRLRHLSWARGELEDVLRPVADHVVNSFLRLPHLEHLDLGSGFSWSDGWALSSDEAVLGIVNLLHKGSLRRLYLPDDITAAAGFTFDAAGVSCGKACALTFAMARAIADKPSLLHEPVHQGNESVYVAVRDAVQALYMDFFSAMYLEPQVGHS